MTYAEMIQRRINVLNMLTDSGDPERFTNPLVRRLLTLPVLNSTRLISFDSIIMDDGRPDLGSDSISKTSNLTKHIEVSCQGFEHNSQTFLASLNLEVLMWEDDTLECMRKLRFDLRASAKEATETFVKTFYKYPIIPLGVSLGKGENLNDSLASSWLNTELYPYRDALGEAKSVLEAKDVCEVLGIEVEDPCQELVRWQELRELRERVNAVVNLELDNIQVQSKILTVLGFITELPKGIPANVMVHRLTNRAYTAKQVSAITAYNRFLTDRLTELKREVDVYGGYVIELAHLEIEMENRDAAWGARLRAVSHRIAELNLDELEMSVAYILGMLPAAMSSVGPGGVSNLKVQDKEAYQRRKAELTEALSNVTRWREQTDEDREKNKTPSDFIMSLRLLKEHLLKVYHITL